MARYEVTIKEVFSTTITVTANNSEEAIQLGQKAIAEGLDEEPNYNYTLDPEEWEVELIEYDSDFVDEGDNDPDPALVGAVTKVIFNSLSSADIEILAMEALQKEYGTYTNKQLENEAAEWGLVL